MQAVFNSDADRAANGAGCASMASKRGLESELSSAKSVLKSASVSPSLLGERNSHRASLEAGRGQWRAHHSATPHTTC
eukprot:3116437-Amphidinium_carterae.1